MNLLMFIELSDVDLDTTLPKAEIPSLISRVVSVDVKQTSKFRSCVNNEAGLGSHSLCHSSTVPNKPYVFCARNAP